MFKQTVIQSYTNSYFVNVFFFSDCVRVTASTGLHYTVLAEIVFSVESSRLSKLDPPITPLNYTDIPFGLEALFSDPQNTSKDTLQLPSVR